MGVSTNAILFYGYSWDEEDNDRPWTIGVELDDLEDIVYGDDDDGDDDDGDGYYDPEHHWEARYAAALGCPPPAADADAEARTAYRARRKTLVDASPCEVDVHCMNSCPMAYVAVKDSVTVARRGYPQTIEALTINPAWPGQLQRFCQTLGISTAGKLPSWQLVSFWEA